MKLLYLTEPQLEGIKRAIEEEVDKSASPDYNIDSIKYLYNPNSPQHIFIRVTTYGVTGGVPFSDVQYVCVDKNGDIDSCENMFPDLKSRMAFIGDFREFQIKDGVAKFI